MAATTTETSQQRGGRRLASLFQPFRDQDKCYRCKENVYQYEKMAPSNQTVFHTSCFKCVACGQHLTLKNYWTNQIDVDDKEIYCQNHCPRIGAARLDNKAIGIKRAVELQSEFSKGNYGKYGNKPHYNAEALAIKGALNAPKTPNEHNLYDERRPHIDAQALHICGALHAQKLQRHYKKNSMMAKHHYPANIHKKRQQLFVAQKELETELRQEEDELYSVFRQERSEVKKQLSEEFDHEWESRLRDLEEKYNKDFEKKRKRLKDGDQNDLTLQFEDQKKDLEKTMTLKREKKKQSLTLKLIEKEQRMTASLVKKQSEQMLSLLAQKKEEIKRELKQELEQEYRDKQAEAQNHNSHDGVINGGIPGSPISPGEKFRHMEEALDTIISLPTSTELPPPRQPSCPKRDLYNDVSVFDDLDEDVIRVAQNEQNTYTDLVQQLTEHLVTDLEKARAIYRWITVKDLNVMEFDDTIDADTPLGLLRGIKFGTETYHTLFMRLCSYAGLACVEIRGHSKSVGYEPGMKIQPDSFQNTWNAVLIDGDWRLVQCNWGARHLVLNKDPDHKRKDQIRYQYDEHYFLTDSDEFIQEFWPYESEWQLLANSITLQQFEELPFVRSIFFHYGMHFEGMKRAVIDTNERGGVDITVKVPEELENELVFYYQLRFADREKRNETSFKGAGLERFVYQTMVENTVMFSVHVPTTGEYFFEVFANRMSEGNKIGADPNSTLTPFRLKCACKFKIICRQLSGKMHPLPNCATGEWGPKKARRHFDIRPYQDGKVKETDANDNISAGILNVDNEFQLKFSIPRPLQFVAKLRMNHVDNHVLDPFVNLNTKDTVLAVNVTLPQPGQYGLDIYARPKEAKDNQTLSHACKYLINCNKVHTQIDIPKHASHVLPMSKDKWGPAPLFEQLGMSTHSHKESKIKVLDNSHVTIEINAPTRVMTSYQFIREPDEDDREYVSMVREHGDLIRFYVNMPKTGNYMLSIYARREDDDSRSMPNVYNYLIQYSTSDYNLNTSFGSSNGAGTGNAPKGEKGFFKKFSFKK